MKESVFDHYTEFIGFSAEIQKMDDAMEQLKKNLTRTYKVLENLKVGCILPMFWCRTLP